jgi:hypothetical protein
MRFNTNSRRIIPWKILRKRYCSKYIIFSYLPTYAEPQVPNTQGLLPLDGTGKCLVRTHFFVK